MGRELDLSGTSKRRRFAPRHFETLETRRLLCDVGGGPSDFTLIRAFRRADTSSIDRMLSYLRRAENLGREPDAVLVDAYVAGQPGGTGRSIGSDLLGALPGFADGDSPRAGGAPQRGAYLAVRGVVEFFLAGLLLVLAAPACDVGQVSYEMTELANRIGDALTPAIRAAVAQGSGR